MSTALARKADTTATGAVIVIITDPHGWEEPLRHGVALAAASGRKLKVILAGNDELGAAARLDCCRFVGTAGLSIAFSANEARRLLQAQARRLRHELERLGARHGIAVELMVPALPAPAAIWTGGAALTVFGRRRGILLVVHAGTEATLELAARLAAERRQAVRLLRVEGESAGTDQPRLGPWPGLPAETVREDAPLPSPIGGRIATVVLDPLYVERRGLTLETLLAEIRRLMQGDASLQGS